MLRAPSRSPLVQLIARLLIVALVAAAIPTDAIASLPVGEASKLTKSAFGELLAHTGSDPQPYAFTGEPYDPNVGFQYHRARWLDPRAGRFVGMDPWRGVTEDPSSLHNYLYVGASPLNSVDPSGLTENLASLNVNLGARMSLASRATAYAKAGQFVAYSQLMQLPATVAALEFWFSVVSTSAGLLVLTVDWIARASHPYPYSAGPGPRGMELGRDVLQQNLTDFSPELDHWVAPEGPDAPIAGQIFSTEQTDSPGLLLSAIEEKAERLGSVHRRNPNGIPLRFTTGAVGYASAQELALANKVLFVGIPEDPVGWNPQVFWSQLNQLMRRTRVAITVQQLPGFRRTR